MRRVFPFFPVQEPPASSARKRGLDFLDIMITDYRAVPSVRVLAAFAAEEEANEEGKGEEKKQDNACAMPLRRKLKIKQGLSRSCTS